MFSHGNCLRFIGFPKMKSHEVPTFFALSTPQLHIYFFGGGGGGDMPLDPLVLEVFPLDSSHTWM